MLKRIAQLTRSDRLYRLCGRLTPLTAACSLAVLLVGWGWGLGFAPADYQQGDGYRIIYFHVPAAAGSMVVYSLMAAASLVGLVWQWKKADLVAAAMAPAGAVFTFVALVSGAAWGKPMWGAWWVWDARLTSELILLFLYLGALALYAAFADRRTGARAAAILILAGVVNLPIIHYSVSWWNTLHQGASGIAQQAIDPGMRAPLHLVMLGYLLFFITLTLMRLRNLLLQSESHRPWVLDVAIKEGQQ